MAGSKLRDFLPAARIFDVNGGSRLKLDIYAAAMNNPKYRLTNYVQTYTTLLITEKYKYSPDLLSDDYYKTPDYWWVITRYNGILNPLDPVSGLVPGRTIKIPNFGDVKRWLQAIGVTQQQYQTLSTI